MPTGQWFHVEARAGLGTRAKGAWDLTITLPGKPPQSFEALPCDPGWKKLDWLGFVSNADRHAILYLDNLQLENKPPK